MKAAIFDLDGTILDSMWMWRDVERSLLERVGVEATTEIFEVMDTLGVHASADWLIDTYSLPYSQELLWEHCEQTALHYYLHRVSPKPGVIALLKLLRERNIKTSLATLTSHKLADPALESKGIAPLLTELLTVEDVNGVKKNRPDLYLKAASLLGAEPSQTVVFEDALYAIKTAVAAGFVVWAIADPAAKSEEAEIRKTAHRYFEGWDEVLAFVQNNP